MKPGPEIGPASGDKKRVGTDAAGIDRVIRWCFAVFAVSTAALTTLAWYAVRVDRVAAYLNVAGVVYLAMSLVFLGIIAVVFAQGHLGSSKEIEAPKLELFDLEERQ